MPTASAQKTVARDVFLYLLMIFVLASSAAALGTVLFNFINLYVPGQDAGYYGINARSAIQFPLASLVIMFPALIWVLYFLKRDMNAQPAKRELKIRKWLLYLTLFVAGLTVLGDLVTLVYNFLQGDLTARFLLKVFVVLWIAGSIFFYFLKDLHDRAATGRKFIEWITIVITLASLVMGFWVAGSPAAHRAQNNDEMRVANLQMLEGQIITYWQAKGHLPASLTDLADGTIGGSTPPPTDPKTHASYEYRSTGERAYQLCATFETVSDSSTTRMPVPYYGGNNISSWSHGIGRVCFNGAIDPDRYPPIKK